MDKGFPSKKNIGTMLNDQEKIRFLAAIPFTTNFAKCQVDRFRNDIDHPDKYMDIGSTSLFGMTEYLDWDESNKLYTHIYHNPDTFGHARNKFYSQLTETKEKILSGKLGIKNGDPVLKYFIFNEPANRNKIQFDMDAINKRLSTAGWMIAVSNYIKNPKDAIEIYRAKDVIEKCFYTLKNSLDLERLRVHSSLAMENKVFVMFISLILVSYIHKVMADNHLYRTWSMKELFKSLETHKVIHVKSDRILCPANTNHKQIYSAFGLPTPE
jgi:transposase